MAIRIYGGSQGHATWVKVAHSWDWEEITKFLPESCNWYPVGNTDRNIALFHCEHPLSLDGPGLHPEYKRCGESDGDSD